MIVLSALVVWRGLSNRGMVRWRASLAPTVGICFVAKKDGLLRMFFDTRLANLAFVAPPKTRLASAAALGALELECPDLYVASEDINNALYCMVFHLALINTQPYLRFVQMTSASATLMVMKLAPML